MLQISCSADWNHVDTEMRRLARMIPHFGPDCHRLRNNIERTVKDLSLLEIQIRKHGIKTFKSDYEEKLNEVNNILKTFSRMHLIATLSKR